MANAMTPITRSIISKATAPEEQGKAGMGMGKNGVSMMGLGQNGRHFADSIFKFIFLGENCRIRISLKFVMLILFLRIFIFFLDLQNGSFQIASEIYVSWLHKVFKIKSYDTRVLALEQPLRETI